MYIYIYPTALRENQKALNTAWAAAESAAVTAAAEILRCLYRIHTL